MNKTYLFIAISSIALFIVLIIQINWILQTAKVKEELFNEKANMVLSKTTDALAADKETCQKINACIGDDNSLSENDLGKKEKQKIDSLFQHYMRFYNFHIDYTFQVNKPQLLGLENGNGFANYIYNKRLEENLTPSGIELKLIFPDKKQFILAEMGLLFISSIVLILTVLVLFWRTTLSLLKEKKISEQTTDFLNNMTHEFKTPLTNIALAGKMLQKDSTLQQEEKIKHYTGIILEENEKLKFQTEQVLSMAALERSETPLHKTELDFHELLQKALKLAHLQIENKQGHLQVNLNAENFIIFGDKTHLTNVLSNLIDNAIKYSKEKPDLLIETSNIGQNLVFSIADKGIGIEKIYHDQVFDKFFRVPTGDVHDVKGFGLGLAYTKKIITLHNGLIELQSEKGKGTTFKIILNAINNFNK